MTTWCIDIDGTICPQMGDYTETHPYLEVVGSINRLYKKGDYIKIYTARGTTTGIDWREFTEKQLKSWGVKYHELIFGKPEADWYVDDKAINPMSKIWGDGYDHR